MSDPWKVAHEVLPATNSIWQDPLSYDPTRHGPPYLPPTKAAKVAGQVSDFVLSTGYETVYDALPALLVLLRALAVVHQTNHWVTSGPTAYGDHLLFERLYNDVLEEIDAVAERAVGVGQGDKIANVRSQMGAVNRVVSMLYDENFGAKAQEQCVEASLRANGFFMGCLQEFVDEMKAKGSLSRGTDDLLAGIQSKHEEHFYLLKQRASDEWKSV